MAVISRDKRAYGTGHYGISIDPPGTNAGWITNVEGGNAVADVITEKIGGDHLQKKHLGNVKFEEISFNCGTGMSADLYDWMDTAFKHTHGAKGRKNGAVHHLDYDYYELSTLVWQNGIMTEIGLPALDAAGKDAAKMTVKFSPEVTTRKNQVGGQAGPSNFPIKAQPQKQWTNANFRLRMPQLKGENNDGTGACSRVTKIDALSVKQKISENALGEIRHYEKEATSVEIPNLVITLAESHADPFFAWHEDFVIKGNCGEGFELQASTLEYLAADTTTVLFTLTFSNLGIFKITPDKMESGAEGIRKVKVEMYCEDIRFDYAQTALMAGKGGGR